MKRCNLPLPTLLCGFIVLFAVLPARAATGPASAAASAFDAYISTVEARLARQHQSSATFLAHADAQSDPRLRSGEFIFDELTPPPTSSLSGVLLYDWRGTAFVAGATAADFERLMKNFSAYPQVYAPEVLQARVLTQQGDHLTAFMRVYQKHIISAVLDTTYDVTFAQLDATHRYSLSRSTNVSEIAAAGTPGEHVMGPSEEHGYLWRLNTYWTCEERDGGLYMEVESISLAKAAPRGLGWAVHFFIKDIPQDSLDFTLRSTSNALRK